MTQRGERGIVPFLLVSSCVATFALLVLAIVASQFPSWQWVFLPWVTVWFVLVVGYGVMQLYDIECPRQ